eukprot:1320534-Amphidinium_carterae.2
MDKQKVAKFCIRSFECLPKPMTSDTHGLAGRGSCAAFASAGAAQRVKHDAAVPLDAPLAFSSALLLGDQHLP